MTERGSQTDDPVDGPGEEGGDSSQDEPGGEDHGTED